MARIFLFITVIAGIAAGVFGYLLDTQKQANLALYHTTDSNLKKTAKTLADTSKDLESTKSTLSETQKNLDDTASKAKALQDDLSKAQAKASDLEQKITAAAQKVSEAQGEAADLKTKLGEQSAAAQEAKAKVAKLETDLRIKTDDLASQKAEVARLLDLKQRATKGEMPPGITGQVVSINTNWNFVVLNIGEKQGVVPNGELIVYRNKQYISKVRVANTELNTCVADILVESQKSAIQVGDDAMN